MKKITLISIPYEGTASGKKGTSKGPEAIKKMLFEQIEDYDPYIKDTTFDKIDIEEKEANVENLKPEEMIEKVKSTLNETDSFPISIGGEHSITIGILDSLKEKHKDITVLQIDAHLDMRNESPRFNSSPTKFDHSCVMRRIREFGLKTVQVGIRVFDSDETKYVEDFKDTIFTCPIKVDIDEIIKKIKTDNVYITIDVDGIDPSFMPATGTPVQGGLDWYFTIELLKKIFEKKNVIGSDIVEVSQIKNNNLTERGAAQLVYHIMGFKN